LIFLHNWLTKLFELCGLMHLFILKRNQQFNAIKYLTFLNRTRYILISRTHFLHVCVHITA